jgi:uncharacterized membrane protein
MHRYLINQLTAGEFITLLILVAWCVTLSIVYLVRKYLVSMENEANTRYIGFFIGSIMANYAFVLGFIIITLWQRIEVVRLSVIDEAGCLSAMVCSAFAFSASFQGEIVSAIGQYIQVLIQDEWPAMQIGESSQMAESLLTNLFHMIQSYTPETKVESVFYNQFVSSLNAAVEYREKRIQYLNSALINVILFMLVFGIVLIVFLLSLLESKHNKLKLLAILVVTTALSFNLGLALVFDYPLSGTVSVSSRPFTRGVLAPLSHPKPSP